MKECRPLDRHALHHGRVCVRSCQRCVALAVGVPNVVSFLYFLTQARLSVMNAQRLQSSRYKFVVDIALLQMISAIQTPCAKVCKEGVCHEHIKANFKSSASDLLD